ncbi:MAG: HTH domain-containing protein [Candidatus Bathyarchaeia archaeon]
MSEKAILECLKKSAPKDLSIEEVSKETGIGRDTVSKYVYGLEKAGKIILSREVGRAKFYTVKEGKG